MCPWSGLLELTRAERWNTLNCCLNGAWRLVGGGWRLCIVKGGKQIFHLITLKPPPNLLPSSWPPTRQATAEADTPPPPALCIKYSNGSCQASFNLQRLTSQSSHQNSGKASQQGPKAQSTQHAVQDHGQDFRWRVKKTHRQVLTNNQAYLVKWRFKENNQKIKIFSLYSFECCFKACLQWFKIYL